MRISVFQLLNILLTDEHEYVKIEMNLNKEETKMKKINLRVISCLMAVMFVVVSVMIAPLEASAETASPSIIADGKCGDNLTWTLDDNGTFAVSGTGDMWDYDLVVSPLSRSSDVYTRPWQNYCDKIIAVEINNGVTSIGNFAFFSCSALESIAISDGVTSIGYSAFWGCSALENITIPDSVTSIEYGAFYDTAYYNNDANWENEVLYIGNHLIKAKDSVTDKYDIRPGTITVATDAFEYCRDLRSIVIPDSVTSIGRRAFSGCSALESISLPDGVTSIGYDAFGNCRSLTSITIPNSVTSIGNSAFWGCSALESITIPDGVTYIGDCMFRECNSLTGITIPDGVTYIGNYVFGFCDALTDITIPADVAHIGEGAFDCCSALENIWVDENNPNYTSIDGVVYTKDKTSLVCYPAGRKEAQIPDGVTSIGTYAFAGCNALKSITIPDGVTSIGNGAFSGCSALEIITIPDSVTSIEWAFWGCYKLTIYGASGSYAQKYAKENNIPFMSGMFIRDRFFLDVKPGAWYLDAVEYALDNGLFFGVSPKMFAPDESMTRAMLVTVLWRMEGEPAVSGENPFNDVPSGEWYTDAVKWAASNGIVYGISEDKYDPMANITREQAAAILYRYSQYKEYDVSKIADLAAFPDGNETSDFAVTELSWAYAEGLITGVKKGSTDYLEPQGNATRAQVASILMRYKESLEE